jgi:hypothetical protein
MQSLCGFRSCTTLVSDLPHIESQLPHRHARVWALEAPNPHIQLAAIPACRERPEYLAVDALRCCVQAASVCLDCVPGQAAQAEVLSILETSKKGGAVILSSSLDRSNLARRDCISDGASTPIVAGSKKRNARLHACLF